MSKNQSVYGIHAVHFVLKQRPESVLSVFIAEQRGDARLKQIQDMVSSLGISVQRVAPAKLADMTENAPHQGVVAVCRAVPAWDEGDLLEALEGRERPSLLLILDGVQDPHNLGACLRTADATGVLAVVVPKDRAASITPVVRKVASGAAESVPVVTVNNLARFLDVLKQKGVWVKGADGEAKAPMHTIDFTGNVAIVLGSEGDGLKVLTKKQCDELFHIPMLGMVESLNVSVATGVCLYEALRQRR